MDLRCVRQQDIGGIVDEFFCQIEPKLSVSRMVVAALGSDERYLSPQPEFTGESAEEIGIPQPTMHDVGFNCVDDPTECKRLFEQPHAPAFTCECCNVPYTGQCGEFSDAFSFGTTQHNGHFILLRWQLIQGLEQLRFGTVLCHGINDIKYFNYTLRFGEVGSEHEPDFT